MRSVAQFICAVSHSLYALSRTVYMRFVARFICALLHGLYALCRTVYMRYVAQFICALSHSLYALSRTVFMRFVARFMRFVAQFICAQSHAVIISLEFNQVGHFLHNVISNASLYSLRESSRKQVAMFFIPSTSDGTVMQYVFMNQFEISVHAIII